MAKNRKAAEEKRIRDIQAICADAEYHRLLIPHPTDANKKLSIGNFQAYAIEAGLTASAVKLACIRADRPQMTSSRRPSAIELIMKANKLGHERFGRHVVPTLAKGAAQIDVPIDDLLRDVNPDLDDLKAPISFLLCNAPETWGPLRDNLSEIQENACTLLLEAGLVALRIKVKIGLQGAQIGEATLEGTGRGLKDAIAELDERIRAEWPLDAPTTDNAGMEWRITKRGIEDRGILDGTRKPGHPDEVFDFVLRRRAFGHLNLPGREFQGSGAMEFKKVLRTDSAIDAPEGWTKRAKPLSEWATEFDIDYRTLKKAIDEGIYVAKQQRPKGRRWIFAIHTLPPNLKAKHSNLH
jgi:hypothetical protein